MKKKTASTKEVNRWSSDYAAAYIAVISVMDRTWPRKPKDQPFDHEMQRAWERFAELDDKEWDAARVVLRELVRERGFVPYIYSFGNLLELYKARIAEQATDKPNDP